MSWYLKVNRLLPSIAEPHSLHSAISDLSALLTMSLHVNVRTKLLCYIPLPTQTPYIRLFQTHRGLLTMSQYMDAHEQLSEPPVPTT